MRHLACAALATMLVIAPFPAPSEAAVYSGVTVRLELNGQAQVLVPPLHPGSFTMFSPAGAQPRGDVSQLFTDFLGTWACFLYDTPQVKFPAVCAASGTHSPTHAPGPITIMGGGTDPTYGGQQVTLSWGPASDVDGYAILRTNGGLVFLNPWDGAWSAPNFGWTSQIEGQACYMVAAMRAGQVIGWSDISCLVPDQGSAPATMNRAFTTIRGASPALTR